jgi:hypothetical protein
MLAHGFSIDMMVELINSGLATVQTKCSCPAVTEERARVRITEAGRGALLDQLAAASFSLFRYMSGPGSFGFTPWHRAKARTRRSWAAPALSFPKIRSAHSDGAVRKELAW